VFYFELFHLFELSIRSSFINVLDQLFPNTFFRSFSSLACCYCQLQLNLPSISSTFYVRIFCTNVILAAFALGRNLYVNWRVKCWWNWHLYISFCNMILIYLCESSFYHKNQLLLWFFISDKKGHFVPIKYCS